MDHREHLPIGAELVGEYRIDGLLGSGGFGVTYKATDLGLGTSLAIKEYFPSEFGLRDGTLSITPRSERVVKIFDWGRARFIEEARIMARFDHPNIAKVFRVFEALNTAYIVLKFETGTSLRSWLSELGSAPTQGELDMLVAPLLDALEVLHSHSYIHRDIAPYNILIRSDGSPVLIDFGSARQAIAQETQTLTGIVKPGYSPPEQYIARGTRQGPWTDIYALGATLYRAISGETPLDGPDRQLEDLLKPAVEVAATDYRPEFLSAIDQMLILKPDDRPQSIAALRPLLLATLDAAAAPSAAHSVSDERPERPQVSTETKGDDLPQVGGSVGNVNSVSAFQDAAATSIAKTERPRRRALWTFIFLIFLASASAAGFSYYNYIEQQQADAARKKAEEARRALAFKAQEKAAKVRAAKARAAEAERARRALDIKRKADAAWRSAEEAWRSAEEARRRRRAQAKPVVPLTPRDGRGWLGVQIQKVTKDIAESLGLTSQKGALVAGIVKGGPAAGANLRVGDVVPAVDDAEVQDSRDLARKISAKDPGARTTIAFVRDGKTLSITLVLGRLPAPPKTNAKAKPGGSSADKVLDLTVSDITASLRKQHGLSASLNGVVVTAVSGAPKEKGLQLGDVIEEVNQFATKSVAAYASEVEKARQAGRKAVLMLVRNAKGDIRFVAIPLGKMQ